MKFTYTTEEDFDGDCTKLWHYVTVDGKTHTMDWSPYDSPTNADIELWLELGMPSRITCGPLTREDLDKLHAMTVEEREAAQKKARWWEK